MSKRFMLFIVLLIAALAINAAIAQERDTGLVVSKLSWSLGQDRLYPGYWCLRAKGTVTNNTKVIWDKVVIEAGVIEIRTGNKVADQIATVRNLKPGQRAEFKAEPPIYAAMDKRQRSLPYRADLDDVWGIKRQ